MERRFLHQLTALALWTAICLARPIKQDLEIKLPAGVDSETFFARYVIAGQDFGGWLQPRPRVPSYTIDTANATGVKAILYAPGCAIQTLSLSFAESNHLHYQFVCQPVPRIRIKGAVVHPDRLYDRGVKLEAKYVARWAARFLGLDEAVITDIPIGEAALNPDGRFEMPIPDLLRDPLANAPDHPGELQIWSKDKSTGALLSQLVSTEPRAIKARMGGLKLQSDFSFETVFAQCVVNSPSVAAHDKFGFAFRGDLSESCDR